MAIFTVCSPAVSGICTVVGPNVYQLPVLGALTVATFYPSTNTEKDLPSSVVLV